MKLPLTSLLALFVSASAFAPVRPAGRQQTARLSFSIRSQKVETTNKREITQDTVEALQIQAQQAEISTNFENFDMTLPKKREEEEMSETQKLMKQVKDAGLAGVVSYASWELVFWFVSIPVVLFGYQKVTGHWPDLSDKEDIAKLSAEAFAFVNFARLAVPLRIGLALSTTPWIQENIVDRFFNKSGEEPKQED